MKTLKNKKSKSPTPAFTHSFFSKNSRNSFFSKNSVDNFFSSSTIQPKLQIGKSNDKYEQEADKMADKIMSAPQSNIQRSCQECEEEGKPNVQRKTNNFPIQLDRLSEPRESTQNATPALTSKLNDSKGKGTPLPDAVQKNMGHAFQTNFKNIRIHTDSDAVQMNQDLHARAFTHGSDIYFNKKEYAPNSTSGKRLLAHELTHTIQQNSKSTIRRNKVSGCGKLPPSYNVKTGGHKKHLLKRHANASKLLEKALKELITAMKKKKFSKKIKLALKKWFKIDADNKTHKKYIIRVMTALTTTYHGSRKVTYTCGGDSFPCTYLPLKFWKGFQKNFAVALSSIHICPTWWAWDKSSQELNLIHEWTHKYGKDVNRFFEVYSHDSGWQKLNVAGRLRMPDAYKGFVATLNNL